MAHAHFTLDTYGYKHTLRICNIYYFSQQWLHECASCSVTRTLSCLKLTCVPTHTVIDPATHKESISQITHPTRFYDQNAAWIVYLHRRCQKSGPRQSSFHHHNNNKCMQLNSTNYDVAHYTTAYSAFLHEVNFFDKFPPRFEGRQAQYCQT